MENDFLNKHCKLIKSDGFVLYGICREVTPMYVLFETNQKTSMIGFIEIRELSLDPKFYGAMII